MAFHALGLRDELVQGILATGYTAPTAIQSQAIPIAIAGKDLIGCAQTGTGKTAAFALPLLHRLSIQAPDPHHKKVVRALVLTPTRELAVQVEDFIKTYGRFMHVRSLCVYGGVGINPQLDALRRGVDIVIATPGRLLDHINRRSINLSHVEMLVLDEADRMFDMGFIDDVRDIIELTPTGRQTLLFSATMPNEVRKLASSIMQHPQTVDIGGRRDPVASVTQHVYRVPKPHKLELLLHVLKNEELDNVLVFSRTKHGADKITRRLERQGLKAIAIHSNRTQSQRQRALDGFRSGIFKVLVATDIAARGIDVEGISHVINFDTPTHPEDYIHRIGRTGRASATGEALTFVSMEEETHMRDIERFMGKRLDRKKYEGFTFVAEPEPAAQPKVNRINTVDEGIHEEEDRQPTSNNTPVLERPHSGRGRGPRLGGPRPAPRRDGERSRSAGPNRRSDGPPRSFAPPRDGNPRPGARREGGQRSGSGDARRSGGPGGVRHVSGSGDARRSSGPGDMRRSSGPNGSRSPGSLRRSGGPGSRPARGAGSPQRGDDRRRSEQPRAAGQEQDHSSLHFYATKTKAYKKNLPTSKFTGALFNKDDSTFVHPLDAAKKKKFGWNPFKKTK